MNILHVMGIREKMPAGGALDTRRKNIEGMHTRELVHKNKGGDIEPEKTKTQKSSIPDSYRFVFVL